MFPLDSVLLSDIVEDSNFDYDTLKADEDLEIWVMRVPDTVSCFKIANPENYSSKHF